MLNFSHLRYFHAVARNGNLTRASAELGRTPQTVSHQISVLEKRLGVDLFERTGRGLTLTESGKEVLRYAEEIFSLGEELMDAVEMRFADRPRLLTLGVADVLPKRIAHALIMPAFRLGLDVRIVCRESSAERLLADLAVRDLDVVLSDAPIPPSVSVRAYNHLLGESAVSLMASPNLARALKPAFPDSLDGAPVLLPTEGATLRRELDRWFDAREIRPLVMGEFDDSALLNFFAKSGVGSFAVPSVIAEELAVEMGVEIVATLDGIIEQYFAISLERRVKNPAVSAICKGARAEFFA
ncbi:MAG: LysR family transcriptional regulator [Gemmatimonadota bacterium]